MEVAPLSRRLGALALDMLVGLLVTVGVAAAIIAVMRPWKRGLPEPDRMRRLRPLMQGVALVRVVGFRNVRTPGQRLMGIRHVDARSGGSISAHSAIARDWSSTMMSTLLRQLLGSVQTRDEARWQTLQPQLDIIRQHYDDPEQQQRAMTELCREHDINPLRSCLTSLLPAVASYLPALWSRRRQTLPERIAGLVVVRDDGR